MEETSQGPAMRIVMFYHSLLSDWNHGNAHFLRGIVREMHRRGIEVRVYEPRNAWSLQNLLTEQGDKALAEFYEAYPDLDSSRYDQEKLDLDTVLQDADLVLVHEWNTPELVRRIGDHRARSVHYRLFYHDTHHRLATDPSSMPAVALSTYDGILAYGESLREHYLKAGFTQPLWVWHEAADITMFYPRPAIHPQQDLVWIGNWGDEERTAELQSYLLDPVRNLRATATVYGVRYPNDAKHRLQQAGITYAGWLPNFRVPEIFARHKVTVHIPRRPYTEFLRGIPTIRPFEALACGIPLICSPWEDTEGLFTPGKDFLITRHPTDMHRQLQAMLQDDAMREEIGKHGRETILNRHTCAHRVDELLAIYSRSLGRPHDVQSGVSVG
jgi:spore maturation protein CgeB